MALYSFLAPNSANPTTEYVLPIVIKEQRELQMAQNPIQAVAEGMGSIRAWGRMPSNPAYGIITTTFLLTYNSLHFRSQLGLANPPYSGFLYTYAATLGGMEIAKYDFDSYVIQGGQGTLKEILPGGTTRGTGGATITYRTIPAAVEVNPTAGWTTDGGDGWQIDIKWYTGVWWTNSDGSLDMFGSK